MIKCLNDGTIKIEERNKDFFKVGEKEFLYAVDLISEEIIKKYKNKKVGLLGVARGGLPLLVAISHRTDIRKVDVMQVQMSNSDEKWDFGDAKIIYDTISDDIDEYIILEDIIGSGTSIAAVIKELKDKKKKIVDIYTIVMNERMKSSKLVEDDININYVYLTSSKQWTYFMWENGYLDN